MKPISYLDKRPLIFEGKDKLLFNGTEHNTHILHFKDKDVDPADVSEHALGVMHNVMSAFLFARLNEIGIPTHFILQQNRREQLVHALEMVPVVFQVRNYADADFATLYGIDPHTPLNAPVIEHLSKMTPPEQGNPLMSRDHLVHLGVMTEEERTEAEALARRLNDILIGFFLGAGFYLYDVKFEFGRRYNFLLDDTEIVLGDEVSLRTCRVHSIDKNATDRHNLSQTTAAFCQDIMQKLGCFSFAEREDMDNATAEIVPLSMDKER